MLVEDRRGGGRRAGGGGGGAGFGRGHRKMSWRCETQSASRICCSSASALIMLSRAPFLDAVAAFSACGAGDESAVSRSKARELMDDERTERASTDERCPPLPGR
jgi:hypothetical protein